MPDPAAPPPTPAVRLGLIGCGYVSRYHLAAAKALNLPITAVCDRKLEAAERAAVTTGGRAFTDAHTLLDSGLVDAVILATPHFTHLSLADAALSRGLHVLSEKPLTVASRDAHALLARQADRLTPDGLVFAVNFNQRTWSLWQTVKRLIDESLGAIVRFQWTITDWYRSQRYYDESTWRGTWNGEGGGLLVNQCPHQLDLLCWFFGLPKQVTAITRFGRHHRVETEDEVHALLDFGDFVGTFTASTGEPMGSHFLEIVGDRGVVRVRGRDQIEHVQFATPAGKHTATSQARSTPPESTTHLVKTGDHASEYRDVLDNFVRSCRREAIPIAPVRDAIASVELANAILLSGLEGRSIQIPVDGDAFAERLGNLQHRSRVQMNRALMATGEAVS